MAGLHPGEGAAAAAGHPVCSAREVQGAGAARRHRCRPASLRNTYGDDQPVVNVVKAAVGAGNTMDPAWAGNLVSDEGAVFADFLEFLRPMTIVGKFGN